MALLEVRGLVKYYGSRKVVDGVSFEVNPGEVVGLLGPNGAGKTTSFRMATGQIAPYDGTVWFAGEDVTHLPMYRRARLGMGYLSQEQSIFRKLTVEKNLLAILEALPRSRTLGRRLSKAERWQRTEAALAQFNLLHVRGNQAARCSGGEKRRLEIARCLVCEPQLILLDEPFAAVDPKTTEDIRRNIRELADQGIGILLTDHNVREVVKTADRIYLIVEGQVVCHGTPGELIKNQIAIDAYLGSTFEDDVLMARVAGFGWSSAPTVSTEPFEAPTNGHPPAPPAYDPEPDAEIVGDDEPVPFVPVDPVFQAEPEPVQPPPPKMTASSGGPRQPMPFRVDDTIPPSRPLSPPPPPPESAYTPPAPRFSATTQTILEQEKIRRLIDQLNDRQQMPSAWHELASKGEVAVPVLLEALERRELDVRHMAFRLLESITGENLTFQSDAPDEVRLRQVAHLRARLERRKP